MSLRGDRPLDSRPLLLLAMIAAVHLGAWHDPLLLSALVLVSLAGSIASGAPRGPGWKAARGFLLLALPLAAVPLVGTPGRLWFAVTGGVEVTYEGAREGGTAMLRLAGFAFLAAWLAAALPARELGRTLAWCLGPFGRIGFPVERFALVFSLALEQVPATAERVTVIRKSVSGGPEGGRPAALVDRVADLVGEQLDQPATNAAGSPFAPFAPLRLRDALVGVAGVAAFAVADGIALSFLP